MSAEAEALVLAKQEDRANYAARKVETMQECQTALRDLITKYHAVFFSARAHSGSRIFEADMHLAFEIQTAQDWLKGERTRLWWKRREAGLLNPQ